MPDSLWTDERPTPDGTDITEFTDVFLFSGKFIPKIPTVSQITWSLLDNSTDWNVKSDDADPDYLEVPRFITQVENTFLELAGVSSPPGQGGQFTEQLANDSAFFGDMPPEFTEMSQSTLNSVIAYCILFAIAFVGNLTVFFKVLKEYRKQRGRIPLLILHLSVADLIVCSCVIPIEVTWRITIQWYGGTALCKACQFLRAFGLYLSSMVLICVSMDRFWAIVYPLKVIEGRRRVKVMLGMAWVASMVFSIPQVFFFTVMSHPKFPSFRQCVTSSFLLDPEDAKLYSIFSVSLMYFIPLGVIIFTYSRILVKMIRKSRESTAGNLPVRRAQPLRTFSERHVRRENSCRTGSRRMRLSLRGRPFRSANDLEAVERGSMFKAGSPGNRSLRRRDCEEVDGKAQLILRMSGNAVINITRAKSRTLRMTIVIVLVFVFCWTPYVVMTLWYVFDWKGAKKVDPKIQDGLFLMAVANSCVNPLVYGSFSRNSCGLSKVLTCKGPNRDGRFS